MNCAQGEFRNLSISNMKHFVIKKIGKSLTENTVNNFLIS